LANALSSCLPIEKRVLEELLKRQNLNLLVRPEDLSFEDWLYLRDKLEEFLPGGEQNPPPMIKRT
jgi:16S rRNA A1518/A1519 N6-dimethyltransferase RsmA/KsgA/DIM1 with predicted DNA glycosylase/AP lyase activity